MAGREGSGSSCGEEGQARQPLKNSTTFCTPGKTVQLFLAVLEKNAVSVPLISAAHENGSIFPCSRNADSPRTSSPAHNRPLEHPYTGVLIPPLPAMTRPRG